MKHFINLSKIITFGLIALFGQNFVLGTKQHKACIKDVRSKTLQSKNKKAEGKNFPPMFGKTHFIVGYDHQQYNINKQEQSEGLLAPLFFNDGSIKKALFSPDDNIRKTLIDLIKQEQATIRIAIFSFTDKGIADSLIQSAKNGINVELITDPYTLHSPFSKITYLKKHGIRVYIYKPSKNATLYEKMHDKFILFSKNIKGKSLIWTGSFNFTKSAGKNNQENVIILEDISLTEQFSKQFRRLKQRSTALVS